MVRVDVLLGRMTAFNPKGTHDAAIAEAHAALAKKVAAGGSVDFSLAGWVGAPSSHASEKAKYEGVGCAVFTPTPALPPQGGGGCKGARLVRAHFLQGRWAG